MNLRVQIPLLYALLVFIWATTPLAIVWSVAEIYPQWAMLLRIYIALPLAALLLWLNRLNLPLHRWALRSYFAGAMSLIGSQIFTYAGAPYLSSGMMALMFGLAPIIAGLISHFAFRQRLKALQWFGLLLALMGLSLMCLSDGSEHIHPLGIFLLLMAVTVYAASMFWVKAIDAPVTPMAQATGSILMSALLGLLLMPWIWSHHPTALPEGRALWALLYTTIMASVVAMFCYFKLIQNIQATTLSLTTVMTPIIALLLGAAVNQEHLNAQLMMGVMIILLGLLLYFWRDLKQFYRQRHQQIG